MKQVHQVRGWYSDVELKMNRRQGAEEGAYLDRYVTDEQRSRRLIFSSTPWAVQDRRFRGVARSTRISLDTGLRSRLPKSPILQRRCYTSLGLGALKTLLDVHAPRSGSKRKFGHAGLAEALCVSLWIAVTATTSAQAGPAAGDLTASSSSTTESSTQYGLFGWLDHRSQYGQGVYPEPFLVDDSDLEVNEARLDWLHTRRNDQHSDLVTGEVEKGFGLMTLEVEIPYERDVEGQDVTDRVANIDLGARYPIYQYVSSNELVDSTFGVGFEGGIPTNSSVSKNAELVPKVFNDLKIGDHFTLQSVVGYSTLMGGGEDGGLQTLEYGFVFGYTFQHDQLPLSGLQQLIPVFELSGSTALNHEDRGHSNLLADVGFRANLKTIGRIQPRVGVAFVFPLNGTARDDVHWGVITSLVFEY